MATLISINIYNYYYNILSILCHILFTCFVDKILIHIVHFDGHIKPWYNTITNYIIIIIEAFRSQHDNRVGVVRFQWK